MLPMLSDFYCLFGTIKSCTKKIVAELSDAFMSDGAVPLNKSLADPMAMMVFILCTTVFFGSNASNCENTTFSPFNMPIYQKHVPTDEY